MNSWRRWKNRLMLLILVTLSALTVMPLLAITFYLVSQGASALDLAFFTEAQKPVGELGGGMGHSILGSLMLVGGGALVGIPLGLACGLYLSEYGEGEKLAPWVRSALELLASTPSILIGVFVYVLVVVPMKGFSLAAGAASLALILLPLVARTSEELLRLIPSHLREAGLALGIPRWKVVLGVVLRSARPAILGALILAVARIAGETAPLVFTAFGNPNFSHSLGGPVSALPLQIYTYAISPFEEWHRMAWAGALLLVGSVLVLNFVIRMAGGTHDRGSSD
jgi:phosphate transport system permease protein